MRVSDRQRFWLTDYHVGKARQENTESLAMLSSQKRINALHDDPIGVAKSIGHRANLEKVQDYKKTIDYSKGFVEMTETAIGGITEGLSRIHELSIAMANDTYAQDSRESTVKEIREITAHIVQLANSKYNGRYVFSGFRTNVPALDQDGYYLGDDGQIFLEIDQDSFKKINLSGRDLFESSEEERTQGHFNLVHALETLQDSLSSNNKSGIYKMIDEVAYHMDKTGSFQASVGAVWQSLESTTQRLDLKSEQETKNISQIEDADIYDTSSRFKKAETILQSTLLASNKFLQPSLLNYLD
jgi:flagellar hook-associated protein 3 FlgL